MRIAVSSQGREATSPIDPHFGRAAYFIVYDSESDRIDAISNAGNAQAMQGAGIQAAQAVAKQQVDLVVSGNIGPKAFSALKSAGIRIATWHDGTVEEAIRLVLEQKLQEVDQPNVRGHWG